MKPHCFSGMMRLRGRSTSTYLTMAQNSDVTIAGISIATWLQILTTIGTVVGAFSILQSQVQVAVDNLQELKQEVRELKSRELSNEKQFGTIPAELKFLERRLSLLEAQCGNAKK